MSNPRSHSLADFVRQNGSGIGTSAVPQNLTLGSFSPLPPLFPPSQSSQPSRNSTSFSLVSTSLPATALLQSAGSFSLSSTSTHPVWQPPTSLNELDAKDWHNINVIASERSTQYEYMKGASPVMACARTSALAERVIAASFKNYPAFSNATGRYVFTACMGLSDNNFDTSWNTRAYYQQARNLGASPPAAMRCANATTAFTESLPTGFATINLLDYHPLSETQEGREALRVQRTDMVLNFCLDNFANLTPRVITEETALLRQQPTLRQPSNQAMLQVSIIDRGDYLHPNYRFQGQNQDQSIYPAIKAYTIAVVMGAVDGTQQFIHSVMHPIDTIARPLGHFFVDCAILFAGKSRISLQRLENGVNPASDLLTQKMPDYYTTPIIPIDSDIYQTAKTGMLERRDNLYAFGRYFNDASGPEKVRISTSIALGGYILPAAAIGTSVRFFRAVSTPGMMATIGTENAAALASRANVTTSMAGAASASGLLAALSDTPPLVTQITKAATRGSKYAARVSQPLLDGQPLFTLKTWDQPRRVNIVRHFSPNELLTRKANDHTILFAITKSDAGYTINAAPKLYKEGHHWLHVEYSDLVSNKPVLAIGTIETGHRHPLEITNVTFSSPVTFDSELKPLYDSLVKAIFKQQQFPSVNATFIHHDYTHAYINPPTILTNPRGADLFTHPEWQIMPTYKHKFITVSESFVKRMSGDHTLLYVLRQDGTFVLTTEKIVQSKIATYHSFGQLANHEPVYAAGHALVRDGKIVIIDNMSPLATTGPKLKNMVLKGFETKGFNSTMLADKFVDHLYTPSHFSSASVIISGSATAPALPSALGFFNSTERKTVKLHLHPPHFKSEDKHNAAHSIKRNS